MTHARSQMDPDLDWIAELTRQEREGIDRSNLPGVEPTGRDWDGPVSDEAAEQARDINADLRRP